MKTAPWRKPAALAVLTLLCLIVWAPAAVAAGDQAFRAEYEVLVDGKPRLETQIELSQQGDSWTMRSEGHGTKGLARMLRVSNAETSRLEWHDNSFQPIEFQHHSKVAGRDERWSAVFDHEQNQVLLHHEEGTSDFEISPGAWDPLSLTLELRRRLAAGDTDFEVRVADEDEIDMHRYRAGAVQNLETGIGCMEVIELERVRENSKRYSRGWYAIEHDYMPVRIQHGKTGSKDFDMRIRKLVMADNDIQAPAACPQ